MVVERKEGREGKKDKQKKMGSGDPLEAEVRRIARLLSVPGDRQATDWIQDTSRGLEHVKHE